MLNNTFIRSFLSDDTHGHTLGKGAIAGVTTLGSAKIFQFLIKLCISRLGIEIFGIYSILLTTYTSFYTLGALGVPLGITRYLALHLGDRDTKKIHKTINAGFSYIVVLGITIGILMTLNSSYLADATKIPLYGTYYRYFGFILTGSMLLFLIRQIFFGLLQFTKAYILEGFESFIRLCGIALVVLGFHQGFDAVIKIYCLSVTITTLISVYILKKSLPNLRFSFEYSKDLLYFTVPVGGSEIVTTVTNSIVLIILASSKGLSEVGVYAACLSIISVLSFIPQILLPMHFPLLTRRFGNNQSITRPFWMMILTLSMMLVPLGIILIVYGPWLIGILMGRQYIIPPAAIFWITIANICYAVAVWPTRQIIDMIGDTRINFLFTMFRSLIILISTFLLTPVFGVTGIGIALTLGWGIESVCCLLFINAKHVV